MANLFPSGAWLLAVQEKLNHDEKYAHTARNWEGDIMFQIEPGETIKEPIYLYTDLWHGVCRAAFEVSAEKKAEMNPAYILSAEYPHFKRILTGDLDPMQAMITRKLKVHGSMAYMMRNVPTVLEFVRCCKEVETEFID
jgi:putative sterol carrier protein